jgi:hypothetical protein
MAKGRITADDLSLGMQRVGGLGSLKKSGARRDSPFAFGNDRTQIQEAEKQKTIPENIRPIEDETPPVLSPLHITPDDEANEPYEKKVLTKKKRNTKVSPPQPKVVLHSPHSSNDASATKAESFPERITLNLSEDMRDELSLLASKLQRQRTLKNERITSNTVIRTAVRILLEEFSVAKSDIVNSEQDLYKLAKQRLMKL